MPALFENFTINDLKEMNPAAAGPHLLRYLVTTEQNGKVTHSTLTTENQQINEWLGDIPQTEKTAIVRLLNEAWGWLQSEGLIAGDPAGMGGSCNFCFITRRGRKLLEEEDFGGYSLRKLLPEHEIDPILSSKVGHLFREGSYALAITTAFTEVEIRIRKKAGLPDSEIGVDLARKAFNPDTGPLTILSADGGERVGAMELFAGALGLLKNPGSHRDVDITNPREAAELILFANYLLRVVGDREVERSASWSPRVRAASGPAMYPISLEGNLLSSLNFSVEHVSGASWRAGVMVGSPMARPADVVDPNAVTCHVGEPPNESTTHVWVFDPSHDRSSPITNRVAKGENNRKTLFKIEASDNNYLKISINGQQVYDERVDSSLRMKVYLLAWCDTGEASLRFRQVESSNT